MSDAPSSDASYTGDVLVVGREATTISAAMSTTDLGASVIVLEGTAIELACRNPSVSGQRWLSQTDVERAKIYLRMLSGPFPVSEELIAVCATGPAPQPR